MIPVEGEAGALLGGGGGVARGGVGAGGHAGEVHVVQEGDGDEDVQQEGVLRLRC